MKFYDLDYFIDYFMAIPQQHFASTEGLEYFSVYDWCDVEEERALRGLTERWGSIEDANDGKPGYHFFGETIKSRILNFLLHVQEMTEDES